MCPKSVLAIWVEAVTEISLRVAFRRQHPTAILNMCLIYISILGTSIRTITAKSTSALTNNKAGKLIDTATLWVGKLTIKI